MDGHSYSGIRGYSEKGGGWTSLDYPWMVTVTLASADTLTRGGGKGGHPWTIHGWSQLSCICGYSDKGGGGGKGWTSLDYPWMVTVTLASADTLMGWGKG